MGVEQGPAIGDVEEVADEEIAVKKAAEGSGEEDHHEIEDDVGAREFDADQAGDEFVWGNPSGGKQGQTGSIGSTTGLYR